MCIVIYVNFNDKMNIELARLIYYMQYFIFVGFMIVGLWILFKNKLIRCLTFPIVGYYSFHLFIYASAVFTPEIKEAIYTVKNINYILSISMALSLFIVPLFSKPTKK